MGAKVGHKTRTSDEEASEHSSEKEKAPTDKNDSQDR